MNKVIWIITTKGCSSCKTMQVILEDIIQDKPGIALQIIDKDFTPDWIKDCIYLTDFPTVVFTIDKEVNQHFVGTRSSNKVKKILKDIGF